jgi:putative nucleotidyltransferase with HDIG domain
MRQPTLSNPGKLYVSVVILAGSFAIAASITEMLVTGVRYEWFILAALTVVSGSATVKLPSIPASLSVSETFVFTSVLLFGAPAGTLTVALDGLIISLWLNKQRKELHRVLFNMAAPAVSIWLAAQTFFLLAGITPLGQHPSALSSISAPPIAHAPGIADFLVPLLLFTIAYFLLNSWLIAFAVAFETAVPASVIWRTNFVWLSLNFLCGASVAALLTVYPREINLAYLGAILPLLFVLYLTYRTSMARVEDANRHLAEINGMYISTIEALAMAVDAKDQVTHGHIRRVQSYAVGLAKALGIRDRGLVGAIEAASLLHDMGKLAIPEHILNKPGRLTESEFTKMKLHASIGADILSSIHFPYPVIPIVRHHHENWDGTGYPDGLSGTAIPIGARILSVVDCFDALTSDRPYRPRLSDEQALTILTERRGRMYDPLVVDTFFEVFRTIDIPDNSEVNHTHNAIAHLARSVAEPLTPSAASSQAVNSGLMPYDLGALLRICSATADLPAGDRLAVMATQLRRSIAADTLILQSLDPGGTLRVVQTDGLYNDVLSRHTSALGHGVTGWVAANAQPALNAAASLEFERGTASDLETCVAVPLLHRGNVCGVISLYSTEPNRFTLDHLRILTAAAAPVSSSLISQPNDDAASTITEEELSFLFEAHIIADPTYSARVVLVTGGYSQADRLQCMSAHSSRGDMVFTLTTGDMVCVTSHRPGESEKALSPQSVDGCRVGSCWFPEDGRSIPELLIRLHQRASAQCASTGEAGAPIPLIQ